MLRVGIVGMGFGAAVHLPAFEAQNGVQVVAVADNGSGRAEALAATHVGKLHVFSDGVSLAAWDGVDIVSIAVPPREQEALVRAALLTGKHVLCDKSFCIGANAGKELEHLAHERGLTGGLLYEFRYDPGIQYLIRIVGAGEIGNISHIAVAWQTSGALDPQRFWSWRHDAKQGGGVLVDWFIHVADYVSRIAQSPILCLRARVATNVPERLSRDMVMRAVTAPDECDIVCGFENGVTGEFFVSNASRAPIGHRIEVTGDCGSIVLHHAPPFSASDRTLRLFRGDSETILVDYLPSRFQQFSDERIITTSELIADFISVLGGGCCPQLPTFADGVANWRIIEAALAAVNDRKGQTICIAH